MNKLEEARKIIDECDQIIKDAFLKRMETLSLVVDYKIKNNLQVLDAKREKEIINQKEKELADNEFKLDYLDLFDKILLISKNYQERQIPKKFALIGDNLKHSYSKIVHEFVFRNNDIKARYELNEISFDKLEQFFKEDIYSYNGINITTPFKEEVLKYLDEVDESVKLLKNCNTIKVINNKLIGYNTDYYGFLALLNYYNIDYINKKCYILGTGGAAKTVYNCLKEKALLVKLVSRSKCGENIITYQELEETDIDILINATPVGMNELKDFNPFIKKKVDVAIDLIYNPKRTKFLEFNNSSFNGLPMLIFQALKADEIWYNQTLNLDYEKLEGELSE